MMFTVTISLLPQCSLARSNPVSNLYPSTRNCPPPKLIGSFECPYLAPGDIHPEIQMMTIDSKSVFFMVDLALIFKGLLVASAIRLGGKSQTCPQ